MITSKSIVMKRYVYKVLFRLRDNEELANNFLSDLYQELTKDELKALINYLFYGRTLNKNYEIWHNYSHNNYIFRYHVFTIARKE